MLKGLSPANSPFFFKIAEKIEIPHNSFPIMGDVEKNSRLHVKRKQIFGSISKTAL